MIKTTTILALAHSTVRAIKTNEQIQNKAEESKNIASTMSDDDAKCYADRYPTDVNNTVDPRAHYDNIGKVEGRLSTCARTLTSFESQRYLDKNPSLQRKFGRGGAGGPALQLANQHYQEVGFSDPTFVVGRDEYTEPWFCGATEYSNCQCQGTMYMGPKSRPDNGEAIKTFDEMRFWKTIVKETNDWTMCSAKGMGGDPWPEANKQCWCEPEPQYEPTPCAFEGENCLCNGWVAYGVRQSPDDPNKVASVEEMVQMAFAINDANNTKSIKCASSNFEMADPNPNGGKQCYCDEKKQFMGQDDVDYIKDYWRSTMVQMSMTVVMETASSIEQKTESQISIVETSTAARETSEMKTERSEEEGACATCEIDKAKEEEAKEKKKLEEERAEREKQETIEKEKAERERQEAIRRRREAETLKAAAEQAENARQKAMMEEESRRMKIESDRLEAIAQIERERIVREQEIRRQEEIRRFQMIEIERRRQEQIVIEKQRQQQIVIRQRRAEIERQRVIQEKKLIQEKVEAEIVKQKSITQMEQSLVQSSTTISRTIEKERRAQHRHEMQMRYIKYGGRKLEDIAKEEVTAVTTQYEQQKQKLNGRMSFEYINLNKVKEEQSVIVTTKTREAAQHRRIKEEAMNSTIILRRRMGEVQKSLLTTPSCGATASQSKALENELQQIESEVETNTKIAELESKSESKMAKEADAANTKIFDQEQLVNKLVEEVSVINDKTEYAEAQKEVILEQKQEEQLEKDTVKLEVESFKSNQTALSEESTLKEMASYSQQKARAYSTNFGGYKRKQTSVTKTMSTRTQDINKLTKDLASVTVQADKDKIQKQITQLTSFNEKDKEMLAEEEKVLKAEEDKVKEAEESTKKQEEVYKKAEKSASETEKKVSGAQDQIIANCGKQTAGKKAEQKKQEEKLEGDKKKMQEVETAEKANMAKARANLQTSNKAILDSKTEMNKLRGQKNKLIATRKTVATKAEKQEIDGQIQGLDQQAMTFKQTIDAEVSKKKQESKNMATANEKIQTQQLIVRNQAHTTKTAQELTAFAEMSCLSSTSVMISTAKASSMSSASSTSTTTREYSQRVHRRIKELRDTAKEKRSIAQGAYQQFKMDFKVMKKKATDLKKQHDSYTMSLEEYKSALDMFQMKGQELIQRMKATQNDTVKAGYQTELDGMKKEKEDIIKLIEQDKKDRKQIHDQLKKVKVQIHNARAHIKNLRLDAKKAEDQVVSTIMSQTGSESVCEKKKIQAQQKQIEAEKNEKKVANEKDTLQEKVTAKQLKMNAHELNQKESEEVIQSLMKRKSSVEADSSAGNQAQILETIKGEIETETARAEEEKKFKEALADEIKKLQAQTKIDARKAQTSKDEAKKAYREAVESCDEVKSAGSTDAMETAFQMESTAKEEQKAAVEEEISEMKLIAESTKKTETETITRIEGEIKSAEAKQTEAETIIDSLYKEIKAAKAQMSAPNTKSADIVQLQADIGAREKKIDDQKDIVRIALEEKRKAETEERLIKDSIKEGEDEIANMTKEAKTIQAEADGAKAQAADYIAAQDKINEKKVKKMAVQEIAQQKKLARLEKQLEETNNKTSQIKAESVTAMQSLPAAEHAYALAQKQAKKSEEDSLISTCTKLYVEKKELFTAADKAMSGSGQGSCAVSQVQSCLGCGSGSTGVTQLTVQITNKGLIDSLVDGLFEKTLVADVEEVSATKKTSSVNGEKKSTSAPSGTKLVMTTADDRVSELLAVINDWSQTNDNAAGDVIATPFKYGKEDYFTFVKESTKKKEVDFEKQKQLQKQAAVQVSSVPEESLPYNFSYVQMGNNNGGVVSQLVKNISH